MTESSMTRQTTTVLEARNLKIRRGGVLLVDVPHLQIAEGEILSLIGPNGAGKTTLLQALAHLLKLSDGEVAFRGRIVNSNHFLLDYRRQLAMVFQEPLLFDTTVFGNVASGLKIRGKKRAEVQEIVTEQLERFGISHLKDRSARTLSGGEAQRTSLARAFAIGPEILFLDEPFASLDPPTRESVITDLQRVLQETHTTTILATHDRSEALRLSDRIAVMNGGKIVQLGAPEEVINRPADEFVASFVGVETILAGRVLKRNGGTIVVDVYGQMIEAVGEADPGTPVTLCIRPENVLLAPHESREKTSARNVFPGKIVGTSPIGLYHKIQLDCGFPLMAYVTNHSAENLGLKVGKEVKASFKATAIHVVRRKKN
jgi:tungstate transport system ATP-binding protein